MKARPILERVLLVGLMAAALWAAGASHGSAQEELPPFLPPGCDEEESEIPCVCGPEDNEEELPTCPSPSDPPTCVEFGGDDGEETPTCTSQIAVYTPENNSHVFIFNDNNSYKLETEVFVPFVLKVDFNPMTQEEYAFRVAGTDFVGSQCWPTLPPFEIGGDTCVSYRAHDELVPRDSYGPTVLYVIGWSIPSAQGFNPHDFMLLRSSTESSPIPYPALNSSFDEEVTTKLLKNYDVGDEDPGLSGLGPGISDYVVAFQRVRPVSKKK
jgi:hypothetical protein